MAFISARSALYIDLNFRWISVLYVKIDDFQNTHVNNIRLYVI